MHVEGMFIESPPTAHDICCIAALAFCDERTVRAYFRNVSTLRSRSVVRIEAAIRRLADERRAQGKSEVTRDGGSA
jgi:hypothetical protein